MGELITMQHHGTILTLIYLQRQVYLFQTYSYLGIQHSFSD